ncbi:hypothetical protein CKAH01_09492 [Colletotrichum kahawae]|uniref:Uncharacterized protein n=1 Tax=Colletotrichum kahawae TaxID=34407 RepID=A0AAD9Y1C1_COLKA|nr:hypothetical protein CKAH01_09492 [Colletotrichum kahawae]
MLSKMRRNTSDGEMTEHTRIGHITAMVEANSK